VLTLEQLSSLRLHRVPLGQVAVAELGLRVDYRFPRRTEIILDGIEHVPRDRSVFFAMNHTDRFNYWPFQYALYRRGGMRFTATWVKGKYYESPVIARFLDATNNIPLPSRGYVITTEFRNVVGRTPSADEYRTLRDAVDGVGDASDLSVRDLESVLDRAGTTVDVFRDRVENVFQRMMREVIRLTSSAIQSLDLNVLVFPQGTRSKRLSRGHVGLAEMAQYLAAPIVPVGCNGSDRLYPGSSPKSRGGRVVYRIGAPLEVDGPELGPHRITESFIPFRRDVVTRFGDRLRAITDIVMGRINDLLDEPYRFSEDGESDGVAGVSRFV
jgi:1-acyl-sn-glycerol-3-phosphate acyltransferase